MRAVLLLAVAGVAAFTACGAGSATRPRPIQFGVRGGNIVGYTISIGPNGKVTSPFGRGHGRIPERLVRQLGREIQQAHLAESRICAGSLPDIAARYIRLGSSTFRLRGSCDSRFERVWSDLLRAVGRGPK
ncbi:MAG TPA: hypothetical protein VGK69_01820 [Gaiellaceae bacterium]